MPTTITRHRFSMYFKAFQLPRFIPRLIAHIVLVGPFAATLAVAATVEPATVTLGKGGEITVQVDDDRQLVDIQLQPGGPYPLFHRELYADSHDILAVGDRLFVAEAHRLSVFSRDGRRQHHIPSDIGFTQLAHTDHTLIALEGDSTLVTIDISGVPTPVQRTALDQPIAAISAAGSNIHILTNDGSILEVSIKNREISNFNDLNIKTELSKTLLAESSIYALNHNNELTIYPSQAPSGAPMGRYRSSDTVFDFAVADGVAYLGTARGVTLVDVFNPQQPVWLGSHQQLGQVVQIVVTDRLVWARTDDHRLYTLNVDNPAEPTVVAAYRSPAPITAAALTPDRAYVVTDRGLTAIEFDTRNPLISNQALDFGQGVNFGGQRRAFIDGDLAYVADWFSGIHIYDLRIPQRPELLTSFHTPGSPKGIVVRDGLAYVADDDHGLQVIDVANPLAPRQVAHLPTPGLAYTPKLVGNRLYLASHRGGFQIIDVSDPLAPQLLSDYDTPGKAWSLAVKEQVAYVADDDSGLLIFDVGNPSQPQLIGQFDAGGRAEEVLVDGNIAYIAVFEGSVVSLDISDPRNPRQLGQTAVPGNARGLDHIGDRLIVAGWLAGVHILDVSDPGHMPLLGSYDTPGATWGINARGHLAYAMDWWGGLQVLDIADPHTIRNPGGYHLQGRVNAIAVHDNSVFTAHGSNGMQVFDVKNPLNPTWTTGIGVPGQARDIAIANEVAVIAAGDGGLAFVDISNPYQAKWLASLDLPIDPQRIIVDGLYAYALDHNRGLAIVHIGSDNTPRLISQILGRWSAMAVRGETLYLARNTELMAYHIRGGRATLSARYGTEDPIRHLLALGDNITLVTDHAVIQLAHTPHAITETARASISSPVRDITATDRNLLLLHDHQIDAINRTTLAPHTQYPLLSQGNRLLHHHSVIYLAGQNTIAALQTPPAVQMPIRSDTGYQITLPPSLRLGDYDISFTYSDAEIKHLRNGLRVQQPKFSKPKLSWDAFQKLLQEKKNDTNLFTQP